MSATRVLFDHPYSPVARWHATDAIERRLRAALARAARPAPLDVDAASREELLARAEQMREDLATVATHLPARLGPRRATALSLTTATIAGAVHGALGTDWPTIGLGLGAGVASLYLDQPDARRAADVIVETVVAVELYRATRALVEQARG